MNTYLVLLRGINVGGKNKVSMAALRECLEQLGFSRILTYIASGNVVLQSDQPAAEVASRIESALPQAFRLDSQLIRALVLTRDQLGAIIAHKPGDFGDRPDTYHSDVIFLMGIAADETMPVFNPRESVDRVWAGDGVIYSQRLSALRTKSRLSTAMASPLYKSMTIRSWGTVIKLQTLLDRADSAE